MNIGFFLKKIRKDKHITLNEVAKSTHLTASLLSQIENGKTSPSLNSLEALLRYYRVNISDFFRQVEQKEYIFVKSTDTESIYNQDTGVNMTLLASKLEENVLESYIIEIDPLRQITAEIINREIPGERFIYIMAGAVDATLPNKVITLETGDSLNFKSYVSCMLSNLSPTDKCRLLISGNPPIFCNFK
ncbi:MAG TPA: helix-turn-helix domain-containing protein [Candidatus Wallbacteria bacterium]|nr:helix-turn-helix domain-containing protein [Candidatus Wallbacteria bacterium]